MKKVFAFMLVLMMILTACGQSTNETSKTKQEETKKGEIKKEETNKDNKLEGVPEAIVNKEDGFKVAVVRNLPADDHTKQFLDGARSEGQSFGFKVDTFIADNDDAKFQELVAQAIQKNYDGLIISHGKADYSYEMIKPAVEKGMHVVTFDTVAEKDGKPLENVTFTAQDDMKLAELSLDEIVKLGKDGNSPRILKLWFGPGVPPLDRRQTIYEKYEKEGKIVTVEQIGPSNFQDVQGDMAAKVGAVLAKYPEGSIDAFWGSWDELAKGGYKAMQDAGRTDITMISIDVSNQDMNLMREPNSIWKATAAVDPKLIGIVNMRLLAKKFAGEEVPQFYDLEAKLIRQEQLKPETNMENLHEVVEGWGVSEAFNEPWMDILRDIYK